MSTVDLDIPKIFAIYAPDGLMDNRTFVKILKDADFIDRKLKTQDADIIFTKVKVQGERKIGLQEFKNALRAVSTKRGDPSGYEELALMIVATCQFGPDYSNAGRRRCC